MPLEPLDLDAFGRLIERDEYLAAGHLSWRLDVLARDWADYTKRWRPGQMTLTDLAMEDH